MVLKNKKIFNITKVTNRLQNLSRCLVFPIAILPIAGILFGIGGGFLAAANSNNWGSAAVNIFTIMKGIGQIIFSALGILFASSIAFGFSKKSRGVAAVGGLVAYLGMSVTISMLFIPYTDATNNKLYVTFDPWKLCGDDHLVSNATNKGFLQSVLGINPTIDLSIMGGIIVGWLTCLIHNRTYDIKLPTAFAFFSGEKFVPIACFFMGVGFGIFGFFALPILLYMFYYLGQGLSTGMGIGSKESYYSVGGAFIAYLFGTLEQFLIPTGLNNCFYTNFWYTSAGGQSLVPIVSGDTITSFTTYSGAYTIFFQQMGYIGRAFTLSQDAYNQLKSSGGGLWSLVYTQRDAHMIAFNHFTTEVGTGFMSGRFAVYNYGLPAAGFAIILTSKPAQRKYLTGLMLSAIVTCFTTGIIEPLIFSFVFIAPILYGAHVLIGGLSYMLCFICNVQCGNGFTAGFVDYIFFGLLPGYSSGTSVIGQAAHGTLNLWAGRNGCLFVPIFGLLIIAPLYFFSFYFLIRKLDLKTPGRIEQTTENNELKVKEIKNDELAHTIIDGFGGIDNIQEINNCASRLRIPVNDITKIDKELLMATGAYGININGQHVQVIYGPNVAVIATKVRELHEVLINEKSKK